MAAGGRFKKRPVTGVFTFLCTHMHILGMFDMYSPERFVYGFFLLEFYTFVLGVNFLFILYDINCKFGPKALERLQARVPPGVVKSLPGFFVPPFHTYMHNAICMATNSCRFVPGMGLLRGEPWEMFNSWLKRPKNTRYMSFANRVLTLSFCARKWNNDRVLQLPDTLLLYLTQAFETIEFSKIRIGNFPPQLHSFLRQLGHHSMDMIRRGFRKVDTQASLNTKMVQLAMYRELHLKSYYKRFSVPITEMDHLNIRDDPHFNTPAFSFSPIPDRPGHYTGGNLLCDNFSSFAECFFSIGGAEYDTTRWELFLLESHIRRFPDHSPEALKNIRKKSLAASKANALLADLKDFSYFCSEFSADNNIDMSPALRNALAAMDAIGDRMPEDIPFDVLMWLPATHPDIIDWALEYFYACEELKRAIESVFIHRAEMYNALGNLYADVILCARTLDDLERHAPGELGLRKTVRCRLENTKQLLNGALAKWGRHDAVVRRLAVAEVGEVHLRGAGEDGDGEDQGGGEGAAAGGMGGGVDEMGGGEGAGGERDGGGAAGGEGDGEGAAEGGPPGGVDPLLPEQQQQQEQEEAERERTRLVQLVHERLVGDERDRINAAVAAARKVRKERREKRNMGAPM
jgi:hypothetical protein